MATFFISFSFIIMASSSISPITPVATVPFDVRIVNLMFFLNGIVFSRVMVTSQFSPGMSKSRPSGGVRRQT